MLNAIDLFSGYGGITLALSEYARPLIYCEIEEYAQGILLSNFDKGVLPFAPIWSDVTTLDGAQFKGMVDIVYGGFPCQDISVAGKGAGLEGERSGLFRQIIRICEEASPQFIFLENVPAIRTRGAIEVQEALASIGYDSRWCTLSAAEIGANHKRERWFCLAYSKNIGRDWRGLLAGEMQNDGPREDSIARDGATQSMANSLLTGLEGQRIASGIQSELSSVDSGGDDEMAHSLRNGLPASQVGSVAGEGDDRHTSWKNNRTITKGRPEDIRGTVTQSNWDSEEMADSHLSRLGREAVAGQKEDNERVGENNGRPVSPALERSWWQTEPDVGRVVDGASVKSHNAELMGDRLVHKETREEISKEDHERWFRAERIKACGNGVVPLQVKTAFEILMGIK